MAFLCTLASGSKGNAALLSYGSTHLLIDAGISCRRIAEGLKQFDLQLSDLTAAIITHEHSDHTMGLDTLYRRAGIPVYASAGTAYHLERSVPSLHNNLGMFYAGDDFEIGEIGVETFSTPHDAADSVGFRFRAGSAILGYATDLGHVTPEVRNKLLGAECLFIESNHDLFSLLQGPYPDYLKRRILSKRGHLSNDDCADFALEAVNRGARHITLCHLSEQNNTPELAACATSELIKKTVGGHDSGGLVHVAPPNIVGKPYLF